MVNAQGAGRAIPIATENYIINLFREINPRIVRQIVAHHVTRNIVRSLLLSADRFAKFCFKTTALWSIRCSDCEAFDVNDGGSDQ